MRRLLLIALFLALLGGLLLAAQQHNQTSTLEVKTSAPIPAATTPSRTNGFALKMSPRLSQVPTGAPTARTAPKPQRDHPTLWWQRLDLRLLAFLFGASMLGMLLMRLWPGAVPAAQPLAEAQLAPRIEPALDASDPIEHVNASAMRVLRERLAAIEDDLHSTEGARDELARQLKDVEASLGEAQEKAVALQATLTERDNDIVEINATLARRDEDLAARDARIQEISEALTLAEKNTTERDQQVSSLDDDGVEQRVINVAFEKALLQADSELNAATAALTAAREKNAALTDELHHADQQQNTLREQSEAQIATLRQDARRELSAARSAARESIDALTEKHDALEKSLRETQDALSERDTTLENVRQDLQQHVEQVASLADVRDRLATWQPTVDTLRADLRRKDADMDTLRSELDHTTEQLIAARELADQVSPLQEKLEEQSALTRILKDAADSMRLYKNAADTRGFQLRQLTQQLHEQTERSETAETSHAAARDDIAALNRELAERNTSVGEFEQIVQERDQRIEQLETSLQDETTALAALNAQLDQQRTERAALADDIEQLEALTDEIHSTLETAHESVGDAIDVDTDKLHRRARHSVQRVRDRLEIVQDLERALELDLEDANACLRMTESESIRVNDALNALLPKLNDTSAERDAALAQAAQLEQQMARMDGGLQDRAQLEARCEALQSELSDWMARENDIVARVDALAVERMTLADNLATTRAAHDEAAARATRETVQRVSLGHAIEAHTRRIEELEEELAQSANEGSNASATLAQTTTQLDQTRQELETAREELAAHDGQWRDVETHLETRLADSEAALARSRAEYVAKAAEIDEVIRAAAAERETLARQLREAQGELAGMNKTLKDESQRHGSTEQELATANLALRDALKSVRVQTDQQIQRLRSDLEGAEQTARELTRKLETSSRTQTTYASAVAKLKTELGRSQMRVAALNKSVIALRAKQPPTPAPQVVDKPVTVPVLNRPVSAPPVLTRAVTTKDDDNDA